MQLTTAQKSLISHLADGRFHSGEILGRELSLSRTAVWSLLHELTTLGLDVHAIPGKGYRLGHPLELLNRDQILAALHDDIRAVLPVLEINDLVDSTSTRLGTLARNGAASGTVCIAEAQSGGRGRVGRAWQSPFAGNICMSLLWHFEEPGAMEGLSLAVGVAVARALQASGIVDVGLKWPNDILWHQRKLGGILMEVSGEAHGRHAVVIGIGMNVHVPQHAARDIDQAWTDLTTITGGTPPSRNRLIAAILSELAVLLLRFPQQGLCAYLEEWTRLHCMEGQRVMLQQGTHVTRGEVVGVNEKGLLLLRVDGGEQRAFASGDVRVRPDED